MKVSGVLRTRTWLKPPACFQFLSNLSNQCEFQQSGARVLQAIKKIIASGIVACSLLHSNCYAQEESLALLFIMTVGKTLVTLQQPSIEVTSTKAIYLRESNALPFPGTQCMYTEVEREQVCFGNNVPTRLRLQSSKSLKLGLSPQSISQLKYNISFPLPTPELLPGQVIFPEFDSGTEAVAAEIQKGVERQYEITRNAKQLKELRGLLWLHDIPEQLMDVVADEHDAVENEATEWWALLLLEEDSNVADGFDKAEIKFEELLHEGMLLKPDTCYRITPLPHNKAQAGSDVPCDDESDSKNGQKQTSQQQDSGSEDGTSDEDENADCVMTKEEPGFWVCKEVADYCDRMDSMDVKQEAESDNEMTIGLELTVTTETYSTTDDLGSSPLAKKRKKEYACDRKRANGEPCEKTFGQADHLKRHIENVHEGKREYVCDRTRADGTPCDSAFGRADHLKRHIEKVHEGKREYVCDRKGVDGQPCNKKFGLAANRKTHIETIHEGKRKHACDRKRADGKPCNKKFGQAAHLKTHVKTVHEGKREHACDRKRADGKPCEKTFGQAAHLKGHIENVHEGKREHPVHRDKSVRD